MYRMLMLTGQQLTPISSRSTTTLATFKMKMGGDNNGIHYNISQDSEVT